MQMKNTLGIKETAKRLALSIDALRYYDKIGLVSPKRGENGYRHYNDIDILKLEYLSVMKYAGFSLKEIETMLTLLGKEPSPECKEEAIELLSEKQKEIQRTIYNYSNLLHLLGESIQISERMDSFPEERDRIDNFIKKIFCDIQPDNEQGE